MATTKKKFVRGACAKYSIDQGVTQTLLQTWKGCRLAALKVLQGWESPGRNEALHFGTAVHWFLENWYSSATRDIMKFMTWALPEYAKTAGNDAHTQNYNDMMALVAPLIEQYVAYYTKSDTRLHWESLEQEFDVMFDGFRLRGKIDGLFRREDGKLWIFETKTKGQISPEDIGRALAFDFQSLFYITAVEAATGEEIVGVQYNVLRRSQLRQNQNETSTAFYKRVAEDIRKRPDFYFYRTEASFARGRKQSFRESLRKQLKEFGQWWNNEMLGNYSFDHLPATYRNENSCTMRKWNCEFLTACASNNMSGYTQTRELFRELSDA